MVVSSNGELIELDIVYSKNGMVPEPVTANGIGFVFFGQPELLSLYPTSGPTSGGSKLTIYGKGFQAFGGNITELNCVFTGSNSEIQIVVHAELVSSEKLVCMTPIWSVSEIVTVETTLNGIISIPSMSKKSIWSSIFVLQASCINNTVT